MPCRLLIGPESVYISVESAVTVYTLVIPNAIPLFGDP